MAIAVTRKTSGSYILERSPDTGAYQAFLKQSLKDLSAFQVTDTLLLKEGETVGLASWISFHQLRIQAEECITRANMKK